MEATNNIIKSDTNTGIHYRDLYFRLVACLIGAHLLVMMGEDFSTLHALTMWSYYPTLLINYVIALALAQLVRTITVRLDRKFSWEGNFWPRLLLHFGLGVVAVSIVAFTLVLLYFEAFGQDIMKSTYPKFEFPFSVALLAILNTYYVLYYFYYRVQNLSGARKPHALSYHTTLVVKEGNATISIAVNSVAYIALIGKVIIVRSFDGHDYIYEDTLDNLENKKLDPQQFFRINRKLIANREVCKAFEPDGYGLKVMMEPEPPVDTKISERKARKFREWFNTV